MKRVLIVVSVLAATALLGMGGLKLLSVQAYNSCTCERFNIDNLEVRTGIDIPKLDSLHCHLTEDGSLKQNAFFLHSDVDLDHYVERNNFEKGLTDYYLNSGEKEDHEWRAVLNTKTRRLDFSIRYKD
ncbi:MAG: hypothetical protein N4A46_04515 [Schleiferiaceae bacterium]|jgi:hypothetical protein|nr:hypothetical protein [Schleiferiaceae bacterium]